MQGKRPRFIGSSEKSGLHYIAYITFAFLFVLVDIFFFLVFQFLFFQVATTLLKIIYLKGILYIYRIGYSLL